MILWIAWWGFYSKTEFLRIPIPLLSFQKWLSFEQKSSMRFSRGKWQKTCSFSWQLSDFSVTSTVSIMCRPRNDFRVNLICYRSMLPIPDHTCVFFFFHSSFFFIKLYFLFNKRILKKVCSWLPLRIVRVMAMLEKSLIWFHVHCFIEGLYVTVLYENGTRWEGERTLKQVSILV